MSEQITLNTQLRTVLGKKVAGLRRAGLTPCVLYGPESEPVSLQVDTKHLRAVLHKAGTTRLIHVDIEGDKKPRLAIARALQIHPTKLTPIHADLLEVSERVPVQTAIPVRIGGKVPPAVQRNEAMIRALLDHVIVRALPKDLPQEIVVDGGKLKELSQVLRISDVDVPKGVRIMDDSNRAVARMAALRRGAAVVGDDDYLATMDPSTSEYAAAHADDGASESGTDAD
ncbi:MAG: 50S ribosomal protein L25 [Ardenticatenales bacterium]|nr:50S ribosomal protein L25 [Ardenticatenales bacterium]